MQEDYWVRQYVNMGYKLLNKAKTGLHCSSLGLCRIKWTKDRVFREAKKYKSSGEFKENNGNAYQIACRKGWIQEISKNNGWRLRIKWNHETCFYYASKCIDRADFRKQYQTGYKYARKHKLFDMLNFRVAKVC